MMDGWMDGRAVLAKPASLFVWSPANRIQVYDLTITSQPGSRSANEQN